MKITLNLQIIQFFKKNNYIFVLRLLSELLIVPVSINSKGF